MGFWFFKQIYYIFKNFKLKNFLLLLAFFIIAFFLFNKPSHAFSMEDLSYTGFDSSQMTIIYNFIQNHKGNYDSVLCAYGCNPTTR